MLTCCQGLINSLQLEFLGSCSCMPRLTWQSNHQCTSRYSSYRVFQYSYAVFTLMKANLGAIDVGFPRRHQIDSWGGRVQPYQLARYSSLSKLESSESIEWSVGAPARDREEVELIISLPQKRGRRQKVILAFSLGITNSGPPSRFMTGLIGLRFRIQSASSQIHSNNTTRLYRFFPLQCFINGPNKDLKTPSIPINGFTRSSTQSRIVMECKCT